MTTMPHSRLSNQRSNCERVSRARSITFQLRSATATSKTFFARSTATVVAFILDSSCLVTLTHVDDPAQTEETENASYYRGGGSGKERPAAVLRFAAVLS